MIELSDSDTSDAQIREAALAVLRAHMAQCTDLTPLQEKPFSILAREGGRLVGGLIGKVVWNWLYADLVWVEESLRRRGIGAAVMRRAEERAREKKLTGIYLWTENWQAPSFYAKLGYTQFCEFRDFPPGYARCGFVKYLA